MASCGRADLPGYLFSGTIPLYHGDSAGRRQEQHYGNCYQHRDGSIYIAAGRGYTPDGMITPHLAAPGVNVKVPLVRGGFGTRSGTSISAAQTAGIAALLFEWAIIRDNQPFFTGSSVKYYLQRGARREENMQYPNPEWGMEGGSVSYL